MQQIFEMTDLGEMAYFLGMEIKQKAGEIFIWTKEVCEGNSKKIQNG